MPVQNTLPDPNNRINAAGEDSSGSYGPGFSSVTLTSQQPTVMNRSNSGLAFRSINKYQKFMVDIKYNSLTKAEFNVVYPFLLQRQASLEAFFVELPQYGNTAAGTKNITADADAGSVELTLNSITNISIADMFYITDPNDDSHVKTYKVTKINGSTITITPPIQRKIDVSLSGTEQANFGTPRMRVVVPGNDIQYSVNAQGLYTFSVKLEETLS
tara:strand:+ start:352 stop:996 length:645 start_codon:yes stop_codon:yes gene_type:complete